jgi:hypothetical protein
VTESTLYPLLQLAASEAGARLWRQNVGTAWRGEVTRNRDGSILIRRPMIVHFGLATGSADLIGWAPHRVTEADVGRTLAVFLSVEAKAAKGRMRAEQQAWLDAVKAAGGIGIVARSVDDFTGGLETWRPMSG